MSNCDLASRAAPKTDIISGCLGLRLLCNLAQMRRGRAAADPE
jgi:hypothetical protein